MIGIIMCGGKGTRLKTEIEKPLYEIGNEKMIDRVVRALQKSNVDQIGAIVSDNAPKTKRYIQKSEITSFSGDGNGFILDLKAVLRQIDEPAVSIPVDNALLTANEVDYTLSNYRGNPLRIYTPKKVNELLGMNANDVTEIQGTTCASSGIRVHANESVDFSKDKFPENDRIVSYNLRYAVNINTLEQAITAEELIS